MKKTTIKLFAFLFFALATIQIEAQAFPTDPAERLGTWIIKVQGENLYLTLPDEEPPVFGAWEQRLTYQPLNTTKPELQQFTTVFTGTTNFYYLESVIAGRGVVEILQTDIDNPAIGVQGNASGAADQMDWWNPTRGSGTQIFSENTCATCSWAGKAKRRVQNFALGDDVRLSGGGPVAFDWVSQTLSNEEFDTSSIFVSNPVNNQLTIKGLTTSVNRVSVYSLLGKQVLTRELDGQTSLNFDTSALASGLYLVEMKGDRGSFTKKIVKQ